MNTRLGPVIAVMLWAGSTLTLAATPDAVEAAMRRGVAYLYERQTPQGNWERTQQTPNTTVLGGDTDGGQWGGRTALATYALLASGERPLDDRMVKAVEWLREAKITGNYALGMRANVWFRLPQTKANKAAMEADARRLRTGGATGNVGLFTYQAGGANVDLSCSQYGMLGAWAAAQRTDVFDLAFWQRAEVTWCDQQNEDGGWAYTGRGGSSTIQMTAAGVASLFITQDFAHPGDTPAARPSADTRYAPANITRGIAYLAAELPGHLNAPMLYALYGIERAGVASGYKYFGDVDWYKACSDVILSRQLPDGSWGGQFDNEIETSFALLFLSRGRAPVMVNKLEFDLVAKRTNTTRPADWNLRPRDMANVTRWIEQRTERTLNWQILKISAAPVDDLHDSPIAYLTGRLPVSLSDADAAKLRQYAEEGGLIVASADGPDPFFARTVRTLGEGLFPGRKFTKLDARHVLLGDEQFPLRIQKKPVTVEGLGNGARLFMILVPDSDLSSVYQRQDERRLSAYQFFANAFLYSVEKTFTRFKGQTHVVRPDPATRPSKQVAVARLRVNADSDPEPGGWRRLAAVMHNTADTELTTRSVSLGTDPLDEIMLAHLTGTGAFTLTDPQRAALRTFFDAGGLLIIDACGGSPAFAAAAEAELAKIDPAFVAQINTPMPPDAPLFATADGKPIPPDFRPYARPTLGPLAKAFQLRGLSHNGKLAVIYSPHDLSVGLVGHAVDGIVGYMPEVSTALMRRVIELKSAGSL